MYPPGSTRECDKTHPVLFYVYGGPYSQMVSHFIIIHLIILIINLIYIVFNFKIMLKSVELKLLYNNDTLCFTLFIIKLLPLPPNFFSLSF